MAVIGIDLGTTYSAAAYVDDLGEPRIIPNRDGERITPSAILIQGGLTLVGTQAKDSARSAPNDVVQFVKRQMANPSWTFVSDTGDEFTSEQLSSFILKRLKEDAEAHLGEPVTGAVITVPAYFDDAPRTATRHAGEIAGLTVLHVFNEPTAAALSFGLDQGFRGTALVFDLGGGTFDVSLVRVTEGLFEVIATDGDRNLGGFDWDNQLMDLVARAVAEEGGPNLLDGGMLEADLRQKCELAKKSLSSLETARIFTSSEGQSFNTAISRSQFEEATHHLLSTAEAITEGMVADAGLLWTDLDEVVMVGGSTRMPMVAEMIIGLSGRAPSTAAHADESVALGAAIRASMFEAEGDDTLSPNATRIEDVTSQGLGVLALDEAGRLANTVLIPHNSKVPATRREHFSTVSDQQRQLRLEVTVGDESERDYVKVIHEEPLQIPPYPAGAPIEVRMSFDIDGTIHIEVFDLTANVSLGEVELDRPSNLEPSEVKELAKQTETREIF